MRKSILSITQILAVALLLFALACCTNFGNITVHVQQQSLGQPIIKSSKVNVLVKSLVIPDRFYIDSSSIDGIAIFLEVKAGNYMVYSETWDGSRHLKDTVLIELKPDENEEVNLLLD